MNIDGAILPEDIFFNILSWLPAISVLRFKSVCKSWYSLIRSSSFVDHHRKCINNYNNPTFIIAGNHPFYVGISRPPTLNLLTIKFQSPPVRLELDSPCLHEFSNKEIDMFICNGIVCLHVSVEGHTLCLKTHMNVSLWNPATKQLLDLPQSPFPLPTRHHGSLIVSIGFGFDVETNDYKLVRLFTSSDWPEENRVELYSLKADSWTSLDAVLPQVDYIGHNPKTPYREKTYCWLGRKIIHQPDNIFIVTHFILTFDFTDEVFGTMSLPDAEAADAVGSLPKLAIVRENIAYFKRVDASYIEVWMLYEFGVCESWTQLYKVGPLAARQPLEISENGNFLFFGQGTYDICIYNVVTGEITNYSTQGIFGPQDAQLKVIDYRESLVLVERGGATANSLNNAVHSI
ncbi:hypothetical protein ACHQM5_029607 [Ranunculus cassubicifolius]